MANQLGKRYRCEVCGTEILITKAGEGKVTCDGKDMAVQEPRPIPSSD
ncbi:MAG: desulforedoxin [Chloroflexi bacterium]|nr:desulforedoxin [Chloroflexota bacterium]